MVWEEVTAVGRLLDQEARSLSMSLTSLSLKCMTLPQSPNHAILHFLTVIRGMIVL